MTSLGGELVIGEVVSWWRVGWWRNSLVARWPVTANIVLLVCPKTRFMSDCRGDVNYVVIASLFSPLLGTLWNTFPSTKLILQWLSFKQQMKIMPMSRIADIYSASAGDSWRRNTIHKSRFMNTTIFLQLNKKVILHQIKIMNVLSLFPVEDYSSPSSYYNTLI